MIRFLSPLLPLILVLSAGLGAQESPCFNSRDAQYRTPVGPIVPGTAVKFNFFLSPGTADKVTLVYGEQKSVPLVKSASVNGRDQWSGEAVFTAVGIVPYWFLVEKAGSVKAWGNNKQKINLGPDSIAGLGGVGIFSPPAEVEPYRQTVYDPVLTHNTDESLSGSVVYHLIPDRFKNGDRTNDPVPGKSWFNDNRTVEFHTQWADAGPWTPGKMKDGHKEDDELFNNDFYGGDLEGVIQKLDLLASLGTTHLWMTPIFLSPSNHKYDVSDFFQIDPALGDLKTFQRLVAEAGKRGIKILLDVCFNHASSDSPYLDRYGRYPRTGAFEAGVIQPTSPWYDWFEFHPEAAEPGKKYTSLLGLDALPTFTESSSFRDFAFRKPDSVTQFWLSQGIGGLRMDVADLVSQDFWDEWRAQVGALQPRTFKVADMVKEASSYLARGEFDSVNNHSFRYAALNLARGGRTEETRDLMEMLQENTPPETFSRLLNFISNHDVSRAFWELGFKVPGDANYAQILPRYKMAAVFQFTMPGIPTVYYGDEVGMTGGRDPFNRGPYPWAEDGAVTAKAEVAEFYKKLSQLRKDQGLIFQKGSLKFLGATGSLLSVERVSPQGKRAFVLFNNSDKSASVNLAELKGRWKDLWTGQTLNLGGALTLEPLGWKILLGEEQKRETIF